MGGVWLPGCFLWFVCVVGAFWNWGFLGWSGVWIIGGRWGFCFEMGVGFGCVFDLFWSAGYCVLCWSEFFGVRVGVVFELLGVGGGFVLRVRVWLWGVFDLFWSAGYCVLCWGEGWSGFLVLVLVFRLFWLWQQYFCIVVLLFWEWFDVSGSCLGKRGFVFVVIGVRRGLWWCVYLKWGRRGGVLIMGGVGRFFWMYLIFCLLYVVVAAYCLVSAIIFPVDFRDVLR